jgi:hypothetical protein
VLASLDKNSERKSRAKQTYKQLLKLINYKKNEKTDRFPEYFLPYAISLLARNLNYESLKEDENYLKKLVFS